MTLCLVAAGQLDGMLSLRPIRSVDAAAAQLLVTEAGGAVAFPAADDLSLEMRSPVLAARDEPCWSTCAPPSRVDSCIDGGERPA